MSTQLLTERRGATLVLTLSDPATRNALSPAIYAAGVETLAVAESDDAVRAVVLTGDGGHFSAGGNVHQLEAVRGKPDEQAARIDALGRWVEALRAFPKPVIAAVEGAAAGAGASLAFACDLVVAARDARFSLAYGRLGISPDGGITHQLARTLPRQLALEWLWLAQTRTAAELAPHGLINRLAEPGQALHDALALAGELAAMAPLAVSGVKELMADAQDLPLGTQLASERESFIRCINDADGAEGLTAFRERRAPRFRAR
jgi:enoyl-CoA hydratase/carnithine racemase